ncbi:hypothetical protein F5Y06DRAFT_303403 [Hypoxylon sp. FL0890]|nr:hypothetical protein F5Y06DRAFT_303403 [Hypoxylon sp. FL0890]
MTSSPLVECPISQAFHEWENKLRPKEKTGEFYEIVIKAYKDGSSLGAGKKSIEGWADGLRQYLDEHRERSKIYHLCKKIHPFVNTLAMWMESFVNIGQAASWGAAGVAFVAVRIVLKQAEHYYETFDKLVEIVQDIQVTLVRNANYTLWYPKEKSIHSLLVQDYVGILTFWHRADQILRKKTMRILASGLVKSIAAEWKEFSEALHRRSGRIGSLAQNSIDEANFEKNIRKWIRGTEDHSRSDLQDDIQALQGCHGTCSWIFDDPTFKCWYESIEKATIWYCAPPGSGKTTLSVAVARYLEAEDKKVIYFRYRYNDITTSKPLSAIRSIIFRLWTIREESGAKIPRGVAEMYQTEVKRHHEYLGDEDKDAAVKLVELFLNQTPKVHIIVDGLDECFDPGSAIKLFQRLVNFESYGSTKWFFTGRREPEILKEIAAIGVLEIPHRIENVAEDIRTYLESRRNEIQLKICSNCIERVISASGGNFLYSKLMIGILCDDENRGCSGEIHDELTRLPEGMGGCYVRCLERIARMNRSDRELARRVFVFMVCAIQTLTVNQLLNALAIMTDPCYDDHQSDRVPKLERIKSVCGSLIELDGPKGTREGDQHITFFHKSFPDFLKENPVAVGITRDDLRCFLVDTKLGNLELGQRCLKYLNFRRYEHRMDDLDQILDKDEEHAFLKYAASFWLEHLQHVDHSQDLFEDVTAFARSPSFWAYLAVRAKVRPHMFVGYKPMHTGGFRVGKGQGELSADEHISDLLPQWVDAYEPEGPRILQTLHTYTCEWHEVLLSHPEAWNHCILDHAGRELLPGIKPWANKMVRWFVVSLPEGSSMPALTDVFFCKSELRARVSYQAGGENHWLEISANSGKTRKLGMLHGAPSALVQPERFLRPSCESLVPGLCKNQSTWFIDLKDLGVRWSKGIDEVKELDDMKPLGIEWKMVIEPGSTKACRSAVGLRLTCVKVDLQTIETELTHESKSGSNVLDDAANSSERDSGFSDTDSNFSETNSDVSATDSGHGKDEVQVCDSDCLVVRCNRSLPLVFSWKGDPGAKSQASCAFHPNRKIVVWLDSPEELRILDFDSGEVKAQRIMQQDDSKNSATLAVRDLHFSPCGDYLYLLVVLADETKDYKHLGSKYDIFLSTFAFEGSGGEVLQPCGRVYRVEHIGEAVSKLRPPFVVSYCDASHFYLCLPPFHHQPKLLRFPLGNGITADEPHTGFHWVETLARPIFFPNSTPSRRPRILYRHTVSGEYDELVLALDSLRLLSKESGAASPPMVVRYKIDRENGWRAWNPDEDKEGVHLKQEERTWEMLRGAFIASDQRYKVVVRPRLNYTRKAYLSCH